MRKALLSILFFYLFFILTFPKEQIWFAMENLAKEKGLFFNGEKIEKAPLTLKVENCEILNKGFDIGKLKNATFFISFFYNSVDLSGFVFKIDKTISLNSAKAAYSVLIPFKVVLKAKMSICDIEGEIDLKKRYITLYLNNIKDFNKVNKIFKNIKKNEKGYLFEKRF
ncbi:hypothetical protein [Nitrosophilus labii]|uniref:hypothetical protein n=1 Tax=Nitrosophilus labii TaxID=2706014 RepID=UPI00165755FD|nr:hypothetical protein [Nitrosophilus labii]